MRGQHWQRPKLCHLPICPKVDGECLLVTMVRLHVVRDGSQLYDSVKNYACIITYSISTELEIITLLG